MKYEVILLIPNIGGSKNNHKFSKEGQSKVFNCPH